MYKDTENTRKWLPCVHINQLIFSIILTVILFYQAHYYENDDMMPRFTLWAVAYILDIVHNVFLIWYSRTYVRVMSEEEGAYNKVIDLNKDPSHPSINHENEA